MKQFSRSANDKYIMFQLVFIPWNITLAYVINIDNAVNIKESDEFYLDVSYKRFEFCAEYSKLPDRKTPADPTCAR